MPVCRKLRLWWKKSKMIQTEDISCFGLEESELRKLLYSQRNLWIQCNPYQTTNGVFHRNRGKNSQRVWKHKRSQIARAILRKKNGTGGISLSDFRLYSKAIVTQTVWCWHTHTEEIQTNGTRLKRREIDLITYGSLIFDRGGKDTQKRQPLQ